MKRITCILICILFILALSACKDKEAELQVPSNYYYVNTNISYNAPDSVIRAEARETVNFYGNLEMFLNSYLDGPKSSALESYIPSDTKLVSCVVTNRTAEIVLSEEFSKLTGVRLSTACSAMLLTVHDYIGTETIIVSAENSLLDEKYEIQITMNDVVLMDSVPMEDQ